MKEARFKRRDADMIAFTRNFQNRQIHRYRKISDSRGLGFGIMRMTANRHGAFLGGMMEMN